MSRLTNLRAASQFRLRLLALLTVLAMIAAACGVPDDVATNDDEPTLDTLTPIAPADPVESVDEEEDEEVEGELDGEDTTTTTTSATTTTEPDQDSEEDTDEAESVDTDGEVAADESETTTTAESTTTEAPETTTTAAPGTTETTTTVAPPTTNAAARVLPDIELGLEVVASLTSPIAFATRPGTTDIFIAEQRGRIVRLPNGGADGAGTTLDIRGTVSLGNEQGLLGLAFSPDGGRLYTNHTNTAGSTVITRYTMSGTAATGAEVLLTIGQAFGNHNGGQMAFGPDGYLYIGMGDEGSGGDPNGNGQNPNTLHGSILRIDVSGASGYTIPADNPFADGGGAPEVFIWGIRNAWRFGFDSANGDLWIADVGQDRVEEVTVLRSGTASGANLGWNLIEGNESFRGSPAPAGHIGPTITYAHGSGRCSITGGEVYRGSEIAGLAGTYLYGDFCTGEVFGFRVNNQTGPQRLDLQSVDQLTSFGVDLAGEIYVLSRSGGVFKLTER